MYYNNLGEKILHVDQYSKDPFFFVYLAGITYPNPDYSVVHNIDRFTVWDNYVFEYIVSGSGHIESGPYRRIVTAGDFVFQNKSCQLFYHANREHPFEKMFIIVRGRLIDKLCEAYSMIDNVFVRHIDVGDDFREMLRILEQSSGISASYPEISIRLHRLLQKVSGIGGTELIPDNAWLTTAERLRIYIDNNLETIRTLDDMCAYANLSKSQVIRVFRSAFGITPMKYLMTGRIERAEYLMRMTRLSIQTIAEQLGFADSRHFATMYKKIRGMTPSKYRKDWLASCG